MRKEDRIALGIKEVISELMEKVMSRVIETDPFVKEKHRIIKPLYAALVPDEIFKGSHFERRFVTPFGGVWEKLALVVATERHGKCVKGHEVKGLVGKESLRRIQEVLNRLEHKKKKGQVKPNWREELKYIKEGRGEPISVSVVCDIYIESESDGKRYAFELKGPLPNSDQTKVSKEKLFKLLAMNPQKIDHAFYALPYNPYGKKKDYNWSFPMRWFNMHKDESVLIGDEFWELIGGKGTYQNFIKEVNLLGREYKERIYREYLGIEPPTDFDTGILH
ncbi:MAG: TdeIII family type II restriction endonuclease [Chitinophagales bacterium]